MISTSEEAKINTTPFKRSGKKAPNSCTPWLSMLKGQTNGKRECERRMRQMART